MLLGAAVLGVVAGGAWLARPSGQSRAVPLDAVEQRGEALYRVQCAGCHGTAGEGQPNWKTARPDGSRPAPPHDATGHTWHHPDAVLFAIVKEGGAAAAPPGYPATMPAFRATLTDAQIVEVLTYIKTMWGDQERRSQSTVSEAGPFPAGAR